MDVTGLLPELWHPLPASALRQQLTRHPCLRWVESSTFQWSLEAVLHIEARTLVDRFAAKARSHC